MTPLVVLILLQIYNGKEISKLPSFGDMRTFLQDQLGQGKDGAEVVGIDICLYVNLDSNSSRKSDNSFQETAFILSDFSLDGYRYRFSTGEDPLQSCSLPLHSSILKEEDLCMKYKSELVCSNNSGGLHGPVNVSIVDKGDKGAVQVGNDHEYTTGPSAIQKKEEIQLDGSCYLYWPINNSEMFLYAPLPLSMQREYHQNGEVLILYCPSLADNDSKLELKVTQRYQDETLGYIMEIDDYQYSNNDHVLTLPLFYDLAIASNDFNKERRSIYLTIVLYTKNTGNTLASFDLERKVIVGSFDLLKSSYTVNVHSMVNSIHSRDHLGAAISMFLPDAKSMVEVGVQNGEFAKLILSQWKNCKRYILVDPWDDNPQINNHLYVDSANVDDQQQVFENAIKNIPEFSINKTVILRRSSLEAAMTLAENSVDIVYIDAKHDYHSVLDDMNAWYPKIKAGGLMAGHDYLLTYSHDTIFTVKPAVDKFARDHNLILFRTQDDFPTWMIFKL